MVSKRHQRQTNGKACNWVLWTQQMYLWKLRTRLEGADATDMPWHVEYEKRLPLRDVCIKVPSSDCINWDQENKIIESYLENMGAERFVSGWDWCYARGKIHIGFTWNMTVCLLKAFDISWERIYFVTINLIKFGKWFVWKWAIYMYNKNWSLYSHFEYVRSNGSNSDMHAFIWFDKNTHIKKLNENINKSLKIFEKLH